MSFSLVKAIKSTHRHPLNKLFHLIGLTVYALALISITLYLSDNYDQNLVLSLALWLTAINLFITGHVIENNVKAMTAIILFKYMRSKLYKNELNKENNSRLLMHNASSKQY